MTDTQGRRARARAMFLEAIEKVVGERETFVRERAGEDETLAREVLELLEADDPGFLEKSAATRAGISPPPNAGHRRPKQIGPYRILEEIGEGGMGIVYLAHQEEPVRRRVALKLIKPGMDSRAIIHRFEAERQAVALMDHPSIARVYDAGTTDDGHPYFVMEYVDGVSVSEYCDRHRLSVEKRLELLIDICHAVQHAHQKGIIHRDLKSRNVLVTVSGDRPVPKIIDFGLAKAIGPSPDVRHDLTWAGALLGTLENMSPEQAGVTGLDVDTRTDVYSLGTLLYDLLSGRMPFERSLVDEALLSGSPAILFERDPPRPSERVRDAADRDDLARRRRTSARALERRLREDLDWVVLRAMERDRTRRYATPSELAQDLTRHLESMPVLAGPPSVGYRLRKFLRRRKGVVSAVAIVMTVLIGAVVVTTQARLRAEREADYAQQMTEALTWAFTSIDPSRQGADRDLKVIDLLRRAAVELDEGFLVDAPALVRARVRSVVGETLVRLGNLEEAEPHLEHSWREFLALRPDEIETLDAGNRFAQVLLELSRLSEAESMILDLLDRWERVAGPSSSGAIKARNALAAILYQSGDFAEAERLQRETLELARTATDDDSIEAQQSLFSLGRVLMNTPRLTQARDLFIDLLEVQRRTRGDDHPATLRTMNALAEVLGLTGAVDEAMELWRETESRMTDVLGEDHPLTLRVALNIGETMVRRQREPAGAEPFLRRALEGAERTLDRDHPLVATARYDLAECLYHLARWDGAEPHLRYALAWMQRERGDRDPSTLGTAMMLRLVWLSQGRLEEVEDACRELLALPQNRRPPAPIGRGKVFLELGACLQFQGEHEAAIEMLENAIERFGDASQDVRVRSARETMAKAMIDLGRLSEADAVITRLEVPREGDGDRTEEALRTDVLRGRLVLRSGDAGAALAVFDDATARVSDATTAATRHALEAGRGEALARLERNDEAIAALESSHRGFSTTFGPRHPSSRRVARTLISAFEDAGLEERAALLRD